MSDSSTLSETESQQLDRLNADFWRLWDVENNVQTFKASYEDWASAVSGTVDKIVQLAHRALATPQPSSVPGLSEETYRKPKHGWTCFHCGETFTTVGGARDHFGAKPDAVPGCLLQVREERGALMALRRAEAEIASLRALLSTPPSPERAVTVPDAVSLDALRALVERLQAVRFGGTGNRRVVDGPGAYAPDCAPTYEETFDAHREVEQIADEMHLLLAAIPEPETR